MVQMDAIKRAFEQQFDQVGIIRTERYRASMNALGLLSSPIPYPTLVIVALAYPKRLMRHSLTHLVPSFYTFGNDYHFIMKSKMERVMQAFPLSYQAYVDNHPHNERLMAVLAKIGYFAKNQLIISDELGSYFFIGCVAIDQTINQDLVSQSTHSCGDCEVCLKACPTQALDEEGYHMKRCISYYNQSKDVLEESQILANYCLFGCDICQIVCPKNIGKGKKVHPEFELSNKETISIDDLFTLSEQAFRAKYSDMAYLWKGKTVLMRNALMVMLRQNNTAYMDLIVHSLRTHEAPWYQETARFVLSKLRKKT